MLAHIKAGKISRVIVKDMSRFGHDYLQVGMFTDILFPNFNVILSQLMMEWTAHVVTMNLLRFVTFLMK